MSIFDYKNNFEIIEKIPCKLLWESDKSPKNPQVSILMPVYTNHYYFKIALKSALAQDWNGKYEVVVVDNDTSENNPNQQIIEEFNDPRVRYFRNAENIGMVGNWNRCIMLARAPRITFLHDDDMFLPSTLSTAISVSDKYPGKAVIATLRLIGKHGEPLVDESEYELTRRMLIFKPREIAKISLARALCQNLGNLVGSVFNREYMIELGGVNEDAYPNQDYEIAIRYIERFGGVYIRRPSAQYRIANNTSSKVYSTISIKRKEEMEDIMPKINFPNWFLQKVVDTYCKDFDTNWRHSFAPPEEQAHHMVTTFDRRITTLYCNILNLIEAYRISIRQ